MRDSGLCAVFGLCLEVELAAAVTQALRVPEAVVVGTAVRAQPEVDGVGVLAHEILSRVRRCSSHVRGRP